MDEKGWGRKGVGGGREGGRGGSLVCVGGMWVSEVGVGGGGDSMVVGGRVEVRYGVGVGGRVSFDRGWVRRRRGGGRACVINPSVQPSITNSASVRLPIPKHDFRKESLPLERGGD